MELPCGQCLLKTGFRHLGFETISQILPDPDTDDGILWSNIPTPLLRSGLVGRLFKCFKNFRSSKKSGPNNCKLAMERVVQASF